jgi:two-component system repressor protein LuxO
LRGDGGNEFARRLFGDDWGSGVSEKSILIVDDEVAVRETLAAILRDAGYEVDLAATVAEGRRLLVQHRYGVVLADWRLPDGDGSHIANLASAAGSYAFVMSGYMAHMLPGSVDPRYALTKRIRAAELLAAVRACIGTAPAS